MPSVEDNLAIAEEVLGANHPQTNTMRENLLILRIVQMTSEEIMNTYPEEYHQQLLQLRQQRN